MGGLQLPTLGIILDHSCHQALPAKAIGRVLDQLAVLALAEGELDWQA